MKQDTKLWIISTISIGLIGMIYMDLSDMYKVCNYNLYPNYKTTEAFKHNISLSKAHDWCMNYFNTPTILALMIFTVVTPSVIYLRSKNNNRESYIK